MTAQQLRAFRQMVAAWRDAEVSGWSGGATKRWGKTRESVDQAFGVYACPCDACMVVNQRINAATHRLMECAR